MFEIMQTKLKSDIEKVQKELKISQREVDQLEYATEEDQKKLDRSNKQIKKEEEDREKLEIELKEIK